MRTSEQIKAEIQERFGFVPPFFDPAQGNPQVLEHLWQQTLSAYIGNPLPSLFKEKLSAYLSRYCAVPYCMICHSCSLYQLGIKAKEVLELLESPPPTESNIDEYLCVLAAMPAQLTVMPEPNSLLEESLLYCSIYIFLEGDKAGHIRSEIRRLLGSSTYAHLVVFVAYVKSCHVWMEAHPEVAYVADQRAINHLGILIEEEPGLADFLSNYRQRVRCERQSRAEYLAEITERQRHEAALRQSQERLRLALEAAHMGTWDWNILFVSFNRAGEELVGLSKEELICKIDRDIFPQEVANLFNTRDREVLSHGKLVDIPEEIIQTRDKGLRILHTKEIPIFDGAGRPQYLLGISEDITVAKRAQEEFQQQNLRLQLFSNIALKIRQSLQLEEILQTTVTEVQKILQASRVLIFRLWPSGVGKVVTEAVVPGWPSVISMGITDDCFGPEYIEKYRQGRMRVIEDLKNADLEPCLVEFLHQFGVKAKLVVPILQKQDVWGLLIAHQCDQTRQWQSFEVELLQQLATQVGIALAQAQLLEEETRRRQELAAYNAELQQFAYVASHDLQEPLRKIQAFGDRLKAKYSSALTEQGRDYIERMQNAAGRMQTLIDDLLTFSRVTSKAQPFVSVSLYQVTQEVLSDLEVRIQQTKGRVEVGELPIIDGDPVQMRQLLQNLISNALKFHRNDEPPLVSVRGQLLKNTEQLTESSLATEFCQLIIQDNGIGFEMKYLDRIFNVFQRLHGRSEYEGTGMGLAICRKIAERHNGSITATSTLGQGATFIVTLPIKQTKEKS